MFKDKVFHLRRDGGSREAGRGRLRRPGGLKSEEAVGKLRVDACVVLVEVLQSKTRVT